MPRRYRAEILKHSHTTRNNPIREDDMVTDDLPADPTTLEPVLLAKLVFRNNTTRDDAVYVITAGEYPRPGALSTFIISTKWGKWSTYLQSGVKPLQGKTFTFASLPPLRARLSEMIETRQGRAYKFQPDLSTLPEWTIWPLNPYYGAKVSKPATSTNPPKAKPSLAPKAEPQWDPALIQAAKRPPLEPEPKTEDTLWDHLEV